MRAHAAVLVLLLASGCTAGTAATSSTPSAHPSTAASTSAGPVRLLPSGTTSAYLRTPSGNVTCLLTPQKVECTPKEHDWGVYDYSDYGQCDHDPTVVVSVASTVAVRLSCAGVASTDAEVLPYGSRVELGDIRCVSENQALSCARTDTGVGFTLSRSAIDTNATAAARGSGPLPPTTVTLPADTDTTGFVTPTASIQCDIYGATSVTCFVHGHTWQAPPYDEKGEGPCDADHAVEVQLGDQGPGATRTTCRSDSLGAGSVLGYGHTLRVGVVSCRSATTGVTCRNTRTGHGFEVNRSRFRGF